MKAGWDDLRIFLGVARGGSLSAAGAGLGMDPATVSRRIARLEEALTVPLFVKSPQGYALSGAGERLLPHAEAAEQAALAAEDAVRGQGERLSGVIRVGAPDGCANFLLPQVLSRIGAAHPELELQIVALPRLFNLNRREADMAIGVSAPTGGRVTVQKIADYRLHLAASRAYLDDAPPLHSIDDVKNHRIIGYIPDMIFDKELDYLSEIGVSRVDLASNSVSVQFNWARQGAGLAMVHGFAMPAGPELIPVLPRDSTLTRAFWLIRHADDRRVHRMSRVAALMVSEIRAELGRLEAAA